jgi:hypothetical protein
MKKFNSSFGVLMGAALLGTVMNLSSCSNDTEEVLNPLNNESIEYAPVRVHVSDFSYSVEDLPGTRGVESPASYSEVQAMTLAFYSGATEVCKVTQLKDVPSTYETFGDFSCSLPLGTYTMVVVARDSLAGDVFTLTSPTVAAYTSEKVRETFAKTQSVTIAGTAPVDLGEITLERVVSQLGILSTDVPAENVKIRATFGGGDKSFNPSTGFAIANTGFTTTSALKEAGSAIGVGNFLFLASNEEEMDVTIEVLNADDQVLYTRVVEDVPFKQNRLTYLRGALFNGSVSSSFKLETTWLTEVYKDF